MIHIVEVSDMTIAICIPRRRGEESNETTAFGKETGGLLVKQLPRAAECPASATSGHGTDAYYVSGFLALRSRIQQCQDRPALRRVDISIGISERKSRLSVINGINEVKHPRWGTMHKSGLHSRPPVTSWAPPLTEACNSRPYG